MKKEYMKKQVEIGRVVKSVMDPKTLDSLAEFLMLAGVVEAKMFIMKFRSGSDPYAEHADFLMRYLKSQLGSKYDKEVVGFLKYLRQVCKQHFSEKIDYLPTSGISLHRFRDVVEKALEMLESRRR